MSGVITLYQIPVLEAHHWNFIMLAFHHVYVNEIRSKNSEIPGGFSP